MLYGGKTVILVKCPFRHNTSPVRSKNWWDGRRDTMHHFGEFEPHSYTQRVFYLLLHLSLSDRFIIGGYASNFQPKSPLFADETVGKARAIGNMPTCLLRVIRATLHGFWTLCMRF